MSIDSGFRLLLAVTALLALSSHAVAEARASGNGKEAGGQAEAPAAAGSSEGLSSLGQAFQALVLDNPELLFERRRLSQSEFGLEAIRGEWFPTLELDSTLGRKSVSSATSRSFSYDETSLQLRQNVFNGFRTQSRWDASRLKYERDLLSYRRKLDTKHLELLQAYSNVLRGRRNLEIVQDAVEGVGELLAVMRQRGTGGRSAEVEVQRLESRLLSLQLELYAQERELSTAENAFEALTGSPLSPDAQGIKTADALLPEYQDFLNLPYLLEYARENHALVMEAALLRRVRGLEVKEARSAHYPSVDLVYRYSDNRNVNGALDSAAAQQTDQTLLLQMKWSLFDGFSTSNRVSAASAAASAAEYSVQDVVVRLNTRIRDAWSEYWSASAGLDVARKAATVASETRRNYESLVLSGRRALVEMANVYEEEMAARLERSNQSYSLAVNSYRLPYEAGLVGFSALAELFPVVDR